MVNSVSHKLLKEFIIKELKNDFSLLNDFKFFLKNSDHNYDSKYLKYNVDKIFKKNTIHDESGINDNYDTVNLLFDLNKFIDNNIRELIDKKEWDIVKEVTKYIIEYEIM
ncbi:MAG: hypothetical protein Q4Q23_04250 [Methanobacteriaceae archaeon]|nr:hypothetical protein [Methanobacteriaceae archaeon]